MSHLCALPQESRPNRIPFLGVCYDSLDEKQVIDALLAREPQASFTFVVTPNADHLVRIHRSGGNVLNAYLEAGLCLNDSRIVGFLAAARGLGLPTVPGADLVRSLFQSALDPTWSLLLVGGTKDLFHRLVQKYDLKNARHYEAPMGLLHDAEKFDATLRAIEDNPARLILLAVGSPQQELLAYALQKGGKATGVALCIGAAVEFLVYPERRAPAWLSRLGLEWLYRLVREPRRLWRRYLIDSPRLFSLAYRDWQMSRRSRQ